MPSGGCGEGTAGGSCGGGNGSGTAADVQQISFLQGQLRDKDRRIQAISTQLAEQEERAQQLELDLGQARAGCVGGWAACSGRLYRIRHCTPSHSWASKRQGGRGAAVAVG